MVATVVGWVGQIGQNKLLLHFLGKQNDPPIFLSENKDLQLLLLVIKVEEEVMQHSGKRTRLSFINTCCIQI